MTIAGTFAYEGRGRRSASVAAPSDQFPAGPDSPAGYIADRSLADAVNTAIYLQQPLLVMGEPGTGKTQLAFSIAWELGLPLHKFNTKMDSSGVDLFYRYDSLLHFHDTQIRKEQHDPSKYVSYAALGKAILYSNPPQRVAKFLAEAQRAAHEEASRSVVLIDEIDKASRDFPNDILAETEDLSFEVRETGWPPIAADRDLLPIVVFTSNQERNLPEAFLRRCIFYYIPFPEEAELRTIVRRRLDGNHDAAIARFLDIRSDEQLVKKPATAELIAWLRILARKGLTAEDLAGGDERVRQTYSVLLKNKEDLQRYARQEKNGAAPASV